MLYLREVRGHVMFDHVRVPEEGTLIIRPLSGVVPYAIDITNCTVERDAALIVTLPATLNWGDEGVRDVNLLHITLEGCIATHRHAAERAQGRITSSRRASANRPALQH